MAVGYEYVVYISGAVAAAAHIDGGIPATVHQAVAIDHEIGSIIVTGWHARTGGYESQSSRQYTRLLLYAI